MTTTLRRGVVYCVMTWTMTNTPITTKVVTTMQQPITTTTFPSSHNNDDCAVIQMSCCPRTIVKSAFPCRVQLLVVVVVVHQVKNTHSSPSSRLHHQSPPRLHSCQHLWSHHRKQQVIDDYDSSTPKSHPAAKRGAPHHNRAVGSVTGRKTTMTTMTTMTNRPMTMTTKLLLLLLLLPVFAANHPKNDDARLRKKHYYYRHPAFDCSDTIMLLHKMAGKCCTTNAPFSAPA